MIIKDEIYGEVEVRDSILLELMDSDSLKRLKGISQYGVPNQYYFKKNFNRFDHSIGVMLLLKILGAPLEEQVAGLLHDVSVTSFSHIADWVLSEGHSGKEDYHDSIHDTFVRKTDIPDILKKHKFSTERILDDKNFPLLENNLPDICADRVDYALREIFYTYNPELIKEFLPTLTVDKNTIVFCKLSAASLFANKFLDLQITHWGSKEAVKRYFFFSNALKRGIKLNILSPDDFWKSEREILHIIEASKDQQIKEILKALSNDNMKKIGERVYKKFRYIDPFVDTSQGLKRVSSLNKKFARRLEYERLSNLEGVLV